MFLPGLSIQATAVTKRLEEKFLLFLNGFGCLVHSLAPSAHQKCLIYTFQVSEASLPFIFDNGGLFFLLFFSLKSRVQGCLHVSGRGEQILTQRK